jgi:diguanylate cyclase (GGDEF)-like protein
MPTLHAYLHQITVAKRLCRIIFGAGALTLLVVGIGTGFALYKNWQVRLEASKTQLIRTAEMANMLVEARLLEASKALDASKRELEVALDKGALTPQQAYLILMRANQGLSVHDQSKPLKLSFWIDATGSLVARSDEYPKQALDYSDRVYFTALRDHPEKTWAIGPLVWLPPIQQWVFHMAIPLHDRRGRFEGVIVQQILHTEPNHDLATYLDPTNLGQVMTQFNGGAVSLSFHRAPQGPGTPELSDTVLQAWKHDLAASGARTGTGIWALQPDTQSQQAVVGFATSPLFGLVSFVMLPMATLLRSFLWDNHYLLAYVVLGMLFVIAIFYQAYVMAVQLTIAVDKSLHDPLTKLHNRRSLDETLPTLLRASRRGQSPVSVLFIDIDFFRRFNEEFGHETGDIALVAVGRALASCCRRPMDLVCRWGGEEFVAVLPDTHAMGAEKIASDMLHAVRGIQLQSVSPQQVPITVSIGSVTTIVGPDQRSDDLVDCADKAMQSAKKNGRNQHVAWQLVPQPRDPPRLPEQHTQRLPI